MIKTRTAQKKIYSNNLLLIPARMLDDLEIRPGDMLTIESNTDTNTITISKGEQTHERTENRKGPDRRQGN